MSSWKYLCNATYYDIMLLLMSYGGEALCQYVAHKLITQRRRSKPNLWHIGSLYDSVSLFWTEIAVFILFFMQEQTIL